MAYNGNINMSIVTKIVSAIVGKKTPPKDLLAKKKAKAVTSQEPPLAATVSYMKSLQRRDGYWWFTLEANETIGAEFIFLMHYLEDVDPNILKGIAGRILQVQRKDGTWSLYKDGPACLSSTVECYFALKLAGFDTSCDEMRKAREFILKSGGIEKARVFTKIHLAMFGIVPWNVAPAMPAEFIFFPSWFAFNIYGFSSWARATIVPLLIFMCKRTTRRLPNNFNIDELFVHGFSKRDYSVKTDAGFFSWEYFFILLDKFLKFYEWLPFKPLRNYAINKCKKWTWEHVKEAEDIYPALAYAALAFKSLGYDNTSMEIRKPFEALKMFHQVYTTNDVPALPPEVRDNESAVPSALREKGIAPFYKPQDFSEFADTKFFIHQQCCISPVWDTPWMVMALLEAGVSPSDPALLRAGQWLMNKQITDYYGDWVIKNPKARPGGWSFEFENKSFPDVDDTIEIVQVLSRLKLPIQARDRSIRIALDWLISMQNDDGGFGAFDKNQTCTLVNRIPFSDHEACLDPSSPDISGRMLELLAQQYFSIEHDVVKRILKYIWGSQEKFGGWFARWGINYIYGTWCVLTGLKEIGWDMNDSRVKKALTWLKSIQMPDGGFGESPESYDRKTFIPWKESVPSQTAWALMALMAAGCGNDECAKHAAGFLLANRNKVGGWDETCYTGTGFPGHFYIRYHGYRHYFPLLALARYFKAV